MFCILARFLVAVVILPAMLIPAAFSSAHAHDLPGEIAVTGYFDHSGAEPELALRVPLIMLTNVNLPKRGPGYLDLERIAPDLVRAERAVIAAFGIVADGIPLEPARVTSRISLPSDRAFDSMEQAKGAIHGSPLSVEQNVFWNQGYFDIHFIYPAQPAERRYALRSLLPTGMAERTLISLAIDAPDGETRHLAIAGTTKEIALDPAWHQAGYFFLTKGVEHILIGTDHLLFLICLILPLRRETRRLIGVVTAFTVGHSMTLIPAALGYAPDADWFIPVVEVLIAASIIYMAAENVLGSGTRLRWRIAFGFGLIHGFGFASTLTDVTQFAGSHLLSSLVFFNIGIEFGQILVLALVVPVLAVVFRSASIERSGVILISVLAGHEALHWVTTRAADIPLDAAGPDIYAMLTWVTVILIVALSIGWLVWSFANRARRRVP